MKKDLWIIAAGRGTRMGNITIPKALIEIDGKSNLKNTLDLVKDKFRTVFVVVAREMEDVVSSMIEDWYPSCNVEIVPIESGGGDGKAVLEAYERVTKSSMVTPRAVILWGDAHLSSSKIVDELLKISQFKQFDSSTSPLIIPVCLEKSPYVAINTVISTVSTAGSYEMQAISADFTKYGENHDSGFHDQSIFGVTWSILIPALKMMRNVNYKMTVDGNKFTTQSGELTFLNVVHYLWNIGNPAVVYETQFPLIGGYNTIGELQLIEKKLKESKSI